MTFDKRLLESPVKRAAYSDRTAWLMAKLSKATYIKFDLIDDKLDQTADKILTAQTNATKIKKELSEFITTFKELSIQGKDLLDKDLDELGFAVVDIFDVGGTQAYLARHKQDKVAVLAFRGTEKDPRDIKIDFDATLIEVHGAKIHKGFYEAYKHIEPGILKQVNQVKDCALYVTGHSLGGALAIVAASEMNNDSCAACYTFGSPKVGNYAYSEKVKVPIYRVVNSADLVPGVPPIFFLIDLLISILNFISGWIPVVGKIVISFLKSIKGYVNYGDIRYLMDCSANDFSDAMMISNPDLVTKIKNCINRLRKNWKAPTDDHSLDTYVAKLEQYAMRRMS